MFKLIAIDMDGTLLNEDKTISKENYEAIQTAKSKNVKVVLTTGRPLKGIEKYLKDLKLDNNKDYAITFNGAVIQNIKTGEILSENIMSHDDLKYLYNLSLKIGVQIHIVTKDCCIAPKVNKYAQFEAEINGIPLHIMDFNNLDKNIKIVKIMMSEEPDILTKAKKEIPDDIDSKYSVCQSAPFYIDFLNKKVSKGYGVETLAKYLDISKDEIICIGDAGNDIQMIEYAGLGVAMGNAFEEVKNVANYITKTNNEHGVAHVIEKFILS